jgi:hypothetical protein
VQQAFHRLVDDAGQPEEPVKVDKGLGQDAVVRFLKNTEEFDDVPEQHIDAECIGPEQEKHQDDSHEKGKIFDFILQTPAYKWLVDTLKREARLKRASPDLMEQIGARIRGVLLAYGDEVSRATRHRSMKQCLSYPGSPYTITRTSLMIMQKRYWVALSRSPGLSTTHKL